VAVLERSWWLRTALVVVVFSAVIYLIDAVGRLWGFLGDLLLIFFLAWLVGAILIHVVNSLMRIPHMRRGWAILIVYLGLITLVLDFALLVIPATVQQVKDLNLGEKVPQWVEQLPSLVARLEDFLAGLGIEVDLQDQIPIDSVNDLAATATSFVTDNAATIVQQTFSAFFAIALVIVISFYVVLDGGRRLNEALKVLPPRAERETRFVLHTIDETFHGYALGMLVISLIYGVGTASVMLATGLPAALPTAILSSILLAVPFIGDWLALALPLIIAATAGDFITFIIVLGVLLFVQQVMLNVLTPRILGHAVRMPAMLVIVAVVVGVRLAGIPGALLGVPTVGVLYTLAVHYGMRVRERREAREAAEREAREAAQTKAIPAPGDTAIAGREPARIAGAAPATDDAEADADDDIDRELHRALGNDPA
jgi:predicted PurR-regulated permease PerM